MSIRKKMLVLLCVVAFVPAIITAWLDTKLLRSLSHDLTQRNAAAMSDQALAMMNRIAGEYADIMHRESERVRLLVTLQAEEATRLLGDTSEVEGDVHFEEDFDRQEADLELVPAWAEMRRIDREDEPPPNVSWRHQVFRVSPGTERESVLPLARALIPMIDFYRTVRTPADRLVRWHYVVLDRGLSATYPGHGGYPATFDSRSRPWYRAQKNEPAFRWYRPHFDATTHALAINATMPLFDEDGMFIGITGIDVDLSASFELLRLPEYLRKGSEIIQVAVVRPPLVDVAQAVVIARQSGELEDSNWQLLPELETLAIGDEKTTNAITAAMLERRNGEVRTNVKGREHFVLYRGFGATGGYMVMTVPVERATEAAAAAAGHAVEVTFEHVRVLLLFLVVAMAAVLGIALVASRHFTHPIRQLGSAVEQLAEGHFDTKVDIRTGDELQSLGEAVNRMGPRLENHERVEKALVLAREVQQHLLPPAPPVIPGYDLMGLSVYSEQTGGDYFDYLPLDGDPGAQHDIVVADVSGHGIGPSLLMATTRALLRGGQGRGFAMGALLSHVNRQLAADVSRGHFVTLFLLSLDAQAHTIRWGSAGHDGALLLRARTSDIDALRSEDIPLGIDAAWNYAEAGASDLQEGDIVLICTDGTWDAADQAGNRFGKERITEYLAGHATASSHDICHGLLQAIDNFRGDAVQVDDITIVVVKRAAAVEIARQVVNRS